MWVFRDILKTLWRPLNPVIVGPDPDAAVNSRQLYCAGPRLLMLAYPVRDVLDMVGDKLDVHLVGLARREGGVKAVVSGL